jgi:hypothetical protein
MTGDEQDGDQHDSSTAREAVADARREAAGALARLAEAVVRYADLRIAEETSDAPASDCAGAKRPKPDEFVADELSLLLRDQPDQVRCLLARTRRIATGLPTVLERLPGRRRGCRADPGDRPGRATGHRSPDPGRHRRSGDRCRANQNPETTPHLAAATCGAVGAARLATAAPPRISRTPRHRRTRRRRHGLRHRLKYRQPIPLPSMGCSPPRPAATAPVIHAHRAATPLRPVRRPAPKEANLAGRPSECNWLSVARLYQRRPWRRLDHARRRTLPMHRRTTTNRNGCLRDQSWPEAE